MVAALAGCAGEPGPEDLRRVAAEVVAVYHAWDEARFVGLFAGPKDATDSRESLAWMHARLGVCGAPEPMWGKGARHQRFSAPCQRGALEVDVTLDADGRVVTLRNGAAGVAPEEPLAGAVAPTIAALPEPEGSVLKDRSLARTLGRCELDRTWVVSELAGLFHLRCEGGAAILKIVVDQAGGVRKLKLWSVAEAAA